MKNYQKLPLFRKLISLALALSVCCFDYVCWGASVKVTYPKPESVDDNRNRYPLALLKLAASKVDISLELIPTKVVMQQGRVIKNIETHGEIDLFWTVVDQSRLNSNIRVIKFPIYQQLFGWRLLLVASKNKTQFDAVKSRCDWLARSVISGHDWPEAKLFKNKGMVVATTANYTGLFGMLTKGRANILPRSLFEVYSELDHSSKEVSILDNWAWYYDSPVYFVLSKRNKHLANHLEQGLALAKDNGDFSQLFELYFSDVISRAALSHRRVLNFDELNPNSCL
ncbi:hypothetical protein [Algibacillus agarilyticus]|uniref:hypothetical protein n=1 Tax=Algibacillus agarilyticus TaxID=2234133 RepID=UPI000DCFF0EA|nr:hypothetical protein [Algibacillus agarilyticus]